MSGPDGSPCMHMMRRSRWRPREDAVKDVGAYTSQVIHFASVNDEVVPALLCRPKNVDKPPVILCLHGLGGDKSITQMIEAVFAPYGIATIGIDAQYHGERKRQSVEIISANLEQTRQAMIQTVIDNERAIDYVRSRADLDGNRVGLLGMSMGAILGTTVTAVDPRFSSACLVVGGGRWDLILGRSQHPVAQLLKDSGITEAKLAERMGDVDPINFVAHIAPRPILMVNGKSDPIIPKAATEALYEAAQQPKEIVWLEAGTSRRSRS